MQHIINPLNMLPQDINKAQSLVQLPRPLELPECGSILKLLRARNENGVHPHSCFRVLTMGIRQKGSFLPNCCIQNDLWFQLLDIPKSVLKFKLNRPFSKILTVFFPDIFFCLSIFLNSRAFLFTQFFFHFTYPSFKILPTKWLWTATKIYIKLCWAKRVL